MTCLRSLARILLGMALLATCPVLSAHAESNPQRSSREDAVKLKELADDAARRGDYAEALQRYESAYRIYPSPNMRFNIGLTLVPLGRDAEAMAAFEEFLERAPDAPPSSRAHAEAELVRLAANVGTVRVTGGAPGDEVVVDGLTHGFIPLSRPIHLAPGAHEVEVRSAKSQRKYQLMLRGGESRELVVDRQAPVSAAPRVEAVVPAAEHRSRTRWIWASGGAAVALAAGGAVFGLKARSEYGEYQTTTSPARYSELRSSIQRDSTWANGLFIGAGAAAVGTGILWWLSGRDAPSQGVSLRLDVAPAAALVVSGAF